jgi:3-phosphoshikimate 1-carboxyvinyltransferase
MWWRCFGRKRDQSTAWKCGAACVAAWAPHCHAVLGRVFIMTDYTVPLDQLPDPLPIEPLRKPFDVTITPPGSKSITCRAYVLAALAHGESKIIRPLRADDTDHLLNALCRLGAEARWIPGEGHDGEDVYIKGVGGRFPRGGNLYMGDGGAPTRFMIACACLAAEPVTIDASPRMRERPIAEGVEMLRQLGARIEYVEDEGKLPVRVVPSGGRGGTLQIGRTSTSQFVSAIMLIAPSLSQGVTIEFGDDSATSESYVRVTTDLLGEWGIDIDGLNTRKSLRNVSVTIRHGPIPAYEYVVESDGSSAVYWAVSAAVHNHSRMELYGIAPDSKQPDIRLLDALDDLGMIVSGDESGIDVIGTGGYQSNDHQHDEFNFEMMPDAAVAFAVCAATQAYRITLAGLLTLRVKETDRIAALASELRKVGCTVETGEDWISIEPPKKEHRQDARATEPVIIETYNDHRMAMAFAVLGLVRPGISIRNPACVKKSYPGFWKDFAKLYQ